MSENIIPEHIPNPYTPVEELTPQLVGNINLHDSVLYNWAIGTTEDIQGEEHLWISHQFNQEADSIENVLIMSTSPSNSYSLLLSDKAEDSDSLYETIRIYQNSETGRQNLQFIGEDLDGNGTIDSFRTYTKNQHSHGFSIAEFDLSSSENLESKNVIIESGQTLSQIAEAEDVTIEEIIEANGIKDPDQIFIGQNLVIPSQNLSQEWEQKSYNFIYDPNTGNIDYTIQNGDSFASIADLFSSYTTGIEVTPETLEEYNGTIEVGEKIEIPYMNTYLTNTVNTNELPSPSQGYIPNYDNNDWGIITDISELVKSQFFYDGLDNYSLYEFENTPDSFLNNVENISYRIIDHNTTLAVIPLSHNIEIFNNNEIGSDVVRLPLSQVSTNDEGASYVYSMNAEFHTQSGVEKPSNLEEPNNSLGALILNSGQLQVLSPNELNSINLDNITARIQLAFTIDSETPEADMLAIKNTPVPSGKNLLNSPEMESVYLTFYSNNDYSKPVQTYILSLFDINNDNQLIQPNKQLSIEDFVHYSENLFEELRESGMDISNFRIGVPDSKQGSQIQHIQGHKDEDEFPQTPELFLGFN